MNQGYQDLTSKGKSNIEDSNCFFNSLQACIIFQKFLNILAISYPLYTIFRQLDTAIESYSLLQHISELFQIVFWHSIMFE
jgi:hypothetical protein